MLGDQLYLENIREYVEDHRVIVTYKWLSRELNVPVNAAKQMLYAYVEQNPSASVTYIVSGVAGTQEHREYRVQLVRKDELESSKDQFLEVYGVHVFSVQMGEFKDSSSLFTASYDVCVRNLKEYSRWSPIDCPCRRVGGASSAREWPATSPSTSDSAPTVPAASTLDATPAPPSSSSSSSSSREQGGHLKSNKSNGRSNGRKQQAVKIPPKTKSKKPFFPLTQVRKEPDGNGKVKKPKAEAKSEAEDSVGQDGNGKVKKPKAEAKSEAENQDGNGKVKKPKVEAKSESEDSVGQDDNGKVEKADETPPALKSEAVVQKLASHSNSSIEGDLKKKAHKSLQFLNDSDVDDGESEEEESASHAMAKKRFKGEVEEEALPKESSKTAFHGVKKRKRVQDLSSDEELAPPRENVKEKVKRRKRTKRLVSTMHINEEGEMVTEKVWQSDSASDASEEESMDAAHQSPIAGTKSVPATSDVSPIKPEKKKQSSLFKFLKK